MTRGQGRYGSLKRALLAVGLSGALFTVVGVASYTNGPDSLVQCAIGGAVQGGTLGLVIALAFVWATREKHLLPACVAIFAPAFLGALPWARHWEPGGALFAWLMSACVGIVWSRWCLPIEIDPASPRCWHCGYPTGTDSAVCSECGSPHVRPPEDQVLRRRVLASLILLIPIVSWIGFAATIRPPDASTSPAELGAWIASSNGQRKSAGVSELRRRGAPGARDLLQDPKLPVRLEAMSALLATGVDANAELMAALDDPDPFVRHRAATDLQRYFQLRPENAGTLEAHIRTEQNFPTAAALRTALAMLDPERALELADPKTMAARATAPAAFTRMLHRYARAKAYRDRSTGTQTSIHLDGSEKITSIVSTTVLDRRGGFRWERHTAVSGSDERRCAVWTANRRIWATWKSWGDPKSRRADGIGAYEALRLPEEGLDGVLGLIPGCLIPLESASPRSLAMLPSPADAGVEAIDGVMCDIVAATSPPGSMRSGCVTRLWIDATGALRRITVTYSTDPSRVQSVPGVDPALIERIRQYGRFDTECRLDIQPEFDVAIAPSDTEFTPPSN